MSATDAVSVFSEGTFEEQILELVNYLARSLPEDQRSTYVQPFQDILTTQEGQKPLEEDEERRRKAIVTVLGEVKGFGEGSEREIEGFFNLLLSHVLTLLPLDEPSTKEQLTTLLQTISTADAQPSLKYRILSNLFNTLPRRSGLRLLVHQTLVELISANDELDHLAVPIAEVEKWLSEWEVSPEEKSSFFKHLVDIYSKSGDRDLAYQYQFSYVRSLPASSPSAEPAAVELIASALRLPNIIEFDPLFRLDAVVAANKHELFALLQIFLNDGLEEYKAWEAAHGAALEKYNLDQAQLERKIRLLSLATLGFQNIGRDLPYSAVASALQVEESQVERWVIDGIRAGLISGKISQTAHTLHIVRATPRTFEREQWEALEKRLVAWKSGLAGILEVITAAKKKNTPPAPAAAVAAEPVAATTNGVDVPVPQAQEAAA
ncbi:PCI-domain-containing protein [Panus rudis PR-1116 ss-1]|nr:PCI-domain-containing protein [Panus rudis PR-1116 ss-1]